MKWKALVSIAALLAGCGALGGGNSLDGTFGSLSFNGSVARTSEGSNYVYTIKNLDVAFDPTGAPSPANGIVNPSARFVTTVKTGANQPYRVTFESRAPLKAALSAMQREASFHEIVFVVPKHFVDSADHAGLAIESGQHLWPMGPDLRP